MIEPVTQLALPESQGAAWRDNDEATWTNTDDDALARTLAGRFRVLHFAEELCHGRSDLVWMRRQCEVACVEERDLRRWNIALECLGTSRQEERIVLAPYGQQRRMMCSEVLLEGWVEGGVACVVEQ